MIELCNDKIRISFSDSYALIGITDIPLARNYIQHKSSDSLFSIVLSEVIDGKIQKGDFAVSSSTAGSISVYSNESELSLRFKRLDNMDMDVVCNVTLKDNLSYWNLRIENNTHYAIRSILFPVVKAVVPLSGTTDRILLPKADGYLLPSPSVQEWEGDYPFRRTNQRFAYPGEGRQFPENLCAQLIAYYDEKGGLYIGAHDPNANPKRLGPIWDGNDTLDFTPEKMCAEIPNGNESIDYDIAIGTFRGDWQEAALIYKSWAEKQWWCSKKIIERDDIPNWIKKGAYFLNFRVRYQDSGEDYLDTVPSFCQEWRDCLNIPIVAMMTGWEKHGEWLGPDYFPLFGGEKMKTMCRTLKENGVITFHFGLSGLKLCIRKKRGKDWPQPELMIDYDNRKFFEENLKSEAAVDSAGNVILDSVISSWDGVHGYACVCTKQAESQLVDASEKLVKEYSTTLVQADQIYGGAVSECYNPDHGHPLGHGPWQVTELLRLYRELRERCKKENPDFALSQEFPNELFIQHLDVCHGRVADQPRGIWGVPLFAFLYHEYLPCYGGDWSSLLSDNTCGIYVQAANFVYGSQCAGSPQTAWKDVRNKYPEQCDPRIISMAKQACNLFQRFGNYLVFGKMLQLPKLKTKKTNIEFVGMDFSGWKKKIIEVDSILSCLWEDPYGRKAYAIVNISERKQSIRMDAGDSRIAIIHYSDHDDEISVRNRKIRISFNPIEAAIVELIQ